jgi:hypothetical protein
MSRKKVNPVAPVLPLKPGNHRWSARFAAGAMYSMFAIAFLGSLIRSGDIPANLYSPSIFVCEVLLVIVIVCMTLSLYFGRGGVRRYIEALVDDYRQSGDSIAIESYLKDLDAPLGPMTFIWNWYDYSLLARVFLLFDLDAPERVEKRFVVQDRNWLNLFWIPVRIMRNRQRRALTLAVRRGPMPRRSVRGLEGTARVSTTSAKTNAGTKVRK